VASASLRNAGASAGTSIACALALCAWSCAGSDEPGDGDGAGGTRPGAAGAQGEARDAGRDTGPAIEDEPIDPRCIAPAGAPTAPSTVAEVSALLNALPKPVSVACFVDALSRPLSLQAVDSTFSAQPAQGRGNPRVFIFYPGLTLSVVPAGPGAHLLEMGEARPENQSLKAELEFPIDGELDEAAPYHRVFYDDAITTCGFCHQGETRAEEVASPLAFVSPALRPRPYQRVPLTELRDQLGGCDEDTEPERCALLQALFRVEPPLEHEFPRSYKTFF
jgi:hypothetical protein